MKPLIIKGLGWKPDRLDRRDIPFRRSEAPRHLPGVVDLRADCPPHMDQGKLGSCVAHGVTSVIRYTLKREGQDPRPLSRLQLYFDGRTIENTVKEDSGLTIRDGIKCAADTGVAVEPLWPYNIDRFKQKPFPRVYTNALRFRALTYKRVNPDAGSIKSAIASGWPVVFGFNVFNQFLGTQCASDGMVAIPGNNEAPVGGHCTILVGYGQRPGYITSQNSWSSAWGDHGDCYFPEQFLEEQASDFWIVTKVGLQ
jgi:C1A family cysteine protease